MVARCVALPLPSHRRAHHRTQDQILARAGYTLGRGQRGAGTRAGSRAERQRRRPRNERYACSGHVYFVSQRGLSVVCDHVPSLFVPVTVSPPRRRTRRTSERWVVSIVHARFSRAHVQDVATPEAQALVVPGEGAGVNRLPARLSIDALDILTPVSHAAPTRWFYPHYIRLLFGVSFLPRTSADLWSDILELAYLWRRHRRSPELACIAMASVSQLLSLGNV